MPSRCPRSFIVHFCPAKNEPKSRRAGPRALSFLALLRLILTNSPRAGHGAQTVQGLRRLRRRRRRSRRTSTAAAEARGIMTALPSYGWHPARARLFRGAHFLTLLYFAFAPKGGTTREAIYHRF